MRKTLAVVAAAGAGTLLALAGPTAAQATEPAANTWDGNVTVEGIANGGDCTPWNQSAVDVTWTLKRNANDAGSKYNIASAVIGAENITFSPSTNIEANHQAVATQHGAEPGKTYEIKVVGNVPTNVVTGTYKVPGYCNAWTADRLSLTHTITPAPTNDCLPVGTDGVKITWKLRLLNGDAVKIGGTNIGLDGGKIVKGTVLDKRVTQVSGWKKNVQPGSTVTLKVFGATGDGNSIKDTVKVPAVCPSPTPTETESSPSGTPSSSSSAPAASTGTSTSISAQPVALVDNSDNLPVTGSPLGKLLIGGSVLLLVGVALAGAAYRRGRNRISFES